MVTGLMRRHEHRSAGAELSCNAIHQPPLSCPISSVQAPQAAALALSDCALKRRLCHLIWAEVLNMLDGEKTG